MTIQATPPLQYDISICFDSRLSTPEPLGCGLPAGPTMQLLRRTAAGDLRSAVVGIPPGWASDGPVACSVDVQLFILAGELRVGDDHLTANAFAFHPAGSDWGALSCPAGARCLIITGGEPAFLAAGGGRSERAIGNLYAPGVDWIEGQIDGRPSGIKRKVLWEDPIDGADTRLLVVPAGFEGRGPNWHPCHEEIYCLEGDIGPDDSRLMSPGWYLHNPARGIHGFHEHSHGGAVVLEWHDSLWSFNPAPQPRAVQG